MKGTRSHSIEKIHSVWKNITSSITDTINKINKKSRDKAAGDMGETCTPVSRLDLSGLNREQAKAEIDKLINEKLEKMSSMEFSELDIDTIERERRKVGAEQRIAERRNRRKQKKFEEAQPIVTEEGVFADFKQASIFDVIQPETFPFEEEAHTAPIEGQISLLETIENTEKPAETAVSTEFGAFFDPDDIGKNSDIQNLPDKQGEQTELPATPEHKGKLAFLDGIDVNTSFDSAIDKVFVFYETTRIKLIQICRKTRQKSSEILARLADKIIPAAEKGVTRIKQRLVPLLQRIEAKIEAKLELKAKSEKLRAVLAEKEKEASEKMYLFIELLDRKNEEAVRRIHILAGQICMRAIQLREFGEANKKKVLIGFGAGVAVYAAVTLTIGSMTAYEYIYNGKVLGVAKNQEDVYKIVDIIGDKLSYQYDAEITIDKEKDIRFNKIIAFHQDIDNREDILNRLTYMRDMKANGHGIYVGGQLKAILESEESARNVLKEIQSTYIKNDAGIEYKEVGFAEKVEIKDVETKLGNIQKKDRALEYMMTGAIEKKIHVVQSGETFSEIAKMYGLKQSELKVSNPDVIPEKLHISQEICLNQIVPLVTVQTVEVAQYQETIPFEIAYENTGSLYKNEQTVKSKGSNGEKAVVAEIVRNNGIEASRKEISATILTEPVSQVVLVGTKEPPPLIGTGTLIYPIRGTLTSRYGTRWGRLHAGIDLAAPSGTKIKAADGGQVIFSGYNGALGYTVKIDHGGGRVTVYGHCSKLHVKSGERVFQGQHIANVGNTGRSTGPHVHFEVHINGKTKNPLNYL